MKAFDNYLQHVRISKARKYIRKDDVVLDIGSVDGAMFESWRGFIKAGIGIDPVLQEKIKNDLYTLVPGYFPQACPPGITYDAITLLAVLEHIPRDVQATLGKSCYDLLNKNGRVIITVPSPKVDHILDFLKAIKVIDGMSLEEHYGYLPEHTPMIFSDQYFKLLKKGSFQLGLNNLFVFEKIG